MSTISLRLPDSLHKQVRKLAEQESVSINQLITLALAEKTLGARNRRVSQLTRRARKPQEIRAIDGESAQSEARGA